ncbi:MAG: hypothetical protein WAL04_06035 [Acidimicrobiales bacterium]
MSQPDAERGDGSVLLEQRIDRPQVFYARRVRDDGHYEETTERQGGWRPVFPLRPQDVRELAQAILDCGFFELQAEYSPKGTSIGGSDVTWSAHVGNQSGSVVLRGVPDTPVPAIERLERRLAEILQGAADAFREGEAPAH